MNSELKKFVLKLGLVSVFLLITGGIVFTCFLTEYYLSIYPVALLFFFLFTIAIHAWQLNMAKKDLAKFTRSNMIITFLKLLIYSAFTVIYLAINSTNAIAFVIVVMILYIIFTIIEVSNLMKISGSQNKMRSK